MSTLRTFRANLNHACRNREVLAIGGGLFNPSEIREVLQDLDLVEQALLDALPYLTDVLDDPAQLGCFKPGVVQGHTAKLRVAIAAMTGERA